ncbi:hypothetical protein ACHQM5_025214 [Ranunculus cassubicifolius]
MAWRGSLSRSLISTARSSIRSSLPRLRPPLAAPRRLFTNPRPIGCAQSLIPLHSVVAAARLTSHLSVNARACAELSQGICRSCQDR